MDSTRELSCGEIYKLLQFLFQHNLNYNVSKSNEHYVIPIHQTIVPGNIMAHSNHY